MIRELFHELGEATLEALKAAADEHEKSTQKAFLDGPSTPRYSLYSQVEGLISIMHETLVDRTLRVERDPSAQVLIFSHRCKLCNKRHRVRVDEPMFVGAPDAKAFVDLLYNEVETLLQTPCPNMEIGKK